MSDGVQRLYHAAIEKMAVSPDSKIEKLRKGVSKGEGVPLDPSPVALAQWAGRDENWGQYAFSEMRNSGFIRAKITRFVWYRPSEDEIEDEQASLAGIEAAAIVRLSSMDCSGAVPEIKKRARQFTRTKDSTRVLAALIAHQKMMFSVIAATAEEYLLEEYAKRASLALIYARSRSLEREAIGGMARSAERMVDLICGPQVRDCAAAAAAMRVHPLQSAEAELL